MLNFEKLEDRKCLSYGPMPLEPVAASPPLFPDTAVADFDLESLYQSYCIDGNLSFKEMRALISSTTDEGYTDRFEYLQLQRYLRLSDMPEYVRYFTNGILNGDYTTQETILFEDPTQLINKWFNGDNLPEASFPYVEVQGNLFVDGITPEDAKQQRLGDCYFITALGATAQNCPEAIASMIIEVDENIWIVRFYDLWGGKHFVSIDNRLPYYPNYWNPDIKKSAFADWGDRHDDPSNELWPALLEKAFAQAAPIKGLRDRPNSYDSLVAGDPSWVLRNLTGQREIRIKGIGKQGYIDYLKQNKPITVSHNEQNHSYTIESYNAEEDKFFLRNPWQYSHIYATWEELEAIPIVGSAFGGYVFDINAENLKDWQ